MVNHLNWRNMGLSLVAIVCAAFCATSSLGAVSEYDQAVAVYLQNKFDKALPMFQALSKNEPDNAQVHYYLALCYQQLNQDVKAAPEYEWVVKHTKDIAFKEIVQERLRRTQARLSHSSIGAEAKAAIPEKHDPVSKVIFFSTNWCSVCKAFTPTWEKVRLELQNHVKFEHLNAEDPANFKLVQLYRPKAYPTLVYLDKSDHVIENYAQAPMGEKFKKHLEELGAGK